MPTNNTEEEFLKELGKKLWPPGSEAGAGTTDRLRSSLDGAVYKHAVLGLIFLKYVNHDFAAPRMAPASARPTP